MKDSTTTQLVLNTFRDLELLELGQNEKRLVRDSATTELVLNTYSYWTWDKRKTKAREGQYND